jgi:nucleotide-binding universal stress UspA family protein
MAEVKSMQYSIAVGLDGSDSSWKALQEAVRQSLNRPAVLHIVSIQESAEPSYSASDVLAAEKTTHEKLEKVQIKARVLAESAGVTVITTIVAGSSETAMVQYVKEHKIDLLVVGDTGHSSIWGALLGTTAEKIVRSAPCSVLIVR